MISYLSDFSEHNGPEKSSEEPLKRGEYRLIPVDSIDEPGAGKSDAVNIRELFGVIRDRRRTILLVTAGCLLLGILFALVSPVEYQSEAKVMPESSGNQSQLGNLFQNYGGMLGLGDAGALSGSQDGMISPQVYPQIVNSIAFQQEMMRDTVYFNDRDTSQTLFNYFKDKVGPPWQALLGAPQPSRDLSGLPAGLRQKLRSEQINALTEKQKQVIEELRSRITLEFATETGLITVRAKMPDPLAAAQVCEKAISLLTGYVKEYRTQKAQNVLEFANEQFEIGRERFLSAQDALATFRDQNVNLSTAKAQSRRDYLQAEYDLAYSVYNNVAQKRIQARMNLEQNTPVFKTLQAADVPLERAEPRWIPILIVAAALGFILSFLIIAGQMIYQNFRYSN